MTSCRIGELFLWSNSDSKPVPVESFRGKKCKDLSASDNAIVALDLNGKLTWLTGQPENAKQLDKCLSDVVIKQISLGSNHCAIVDSEGAVFTWGKSSEGQLGLGHAEDRSEPEMVTSVLSTLHSKSVSCGDYHTIVLSDEGDTYAFGRGHEGQTGQGERASECVTLAPQYVKGLNGTKVSKISCGCDFTVVVSTKGEVWSWGSGGVGQLGTGRVSKRFKPMKVSVPVSEKETINEISAGWGHVLATSSTGKLYSWGLNTYGQLGVGDFKTRFYPDSVIMDGIDGTVRKAFSRKHHSACLLHNGTLLSWGSKQGALGHGPDAENLKIPTIVQSASSQSLSHLALANKSMAAFASTSIRKIFPSYGPTKGGTPIQISGSGFWQHPSCDIQLCFIAPGVPAQTVKGTLDVETNIITCLSPSWVEGNDQEEEEEGVAYEEESDAGLEDEAPPKVVTVELSINNVDYTTDHHCFEYYEQAKLTNIEPKYLTVDGNSDVTLSGENLSDFPDIKVRFMEVQNDNKSSPRIVIVDGSRVLRAAPPLDPSVEATEEVMYLREKNRVSDIVCKSPIFPGPLPVKVKVSVALNGYDFTDDDIFATFFDSNIQSLTPASALATGSTVLQLKGHGFVVGIFPKVKFTAGKQIREVVGECISSELVKCKVPAMIMGITEEELSKKKTEMLKDKTPLETENKWIKLAAAQPANHVEGSIQMTFNDRDYGTPILFDFYLGSISSFSPAVGPLRGGTPIAIVPEGKWVYESPTLAVRFENPKFDITIPAKYDIKDNVIRVVAPQLYNPDLLLQIKNCDNELKECEKILVEADKKKAIEKIEKDKKNIQKNIPKNKVEVSVTINGVDFTPPKNGTSFTFYEPITNLKTVPEVCKSGEEICVTGEGMISSKGIIIKFVYDKFTTQCAGKFNKEKNGVTCKMPSIEYIHIGDAPRPVDINVKVFVSFNDSADWVESECIIKYTL